MRGKSTAFPCPKKRRPANRKNISARGFNILLGENRGSAEACGVVEGVRQTDPGNLGGRYLDTRC